MKKSAVLVAAFLAVGTTGAWADDICVGGPRADWMGEDEISSVLSTAGYSGDYVIAIEDGCIEAKLVHNGERTEVYMEPVTGEIVLTKVD